MRRAIGRFRQLRSPRVVERALGLLDEQWYVREYPDVTASGLSAAEHFRKYGFFEGRNPNPLFVTDWYRHVYEIPHGVNCLQHYLTSGHFVGHEPSIFFDTAWYRSQAGRLDTDQSALEDYWFRGWMRCQDPHPLFDAVWYLGQRPHGLGIGTVPYVHFLSFGVREGLSPSPLFDPNTYLSLNGDVAEAGVAAFTHFLSWGLHEGRRTSALVESDYYKAQYPDDLLVHKWGSEAHFARFGCSENRRISPDPLANRIMMFVADRARASRRFATSETFGLTSIDPIDWVRRADAVELPLHDQPRVSIIIPTLNHADDVIRCVETIGQLPDTTSFQVVVVDDGSAEDQHQLLARLRGVDLVRLQRNVGFAGACQAGVESSSGEFILLLNNDTEVLPGWLDSLVDEMDTHPTTGIAGSMVLRADCRLQEAGGIIWSDGTVAHYASGRSPVEGFARFRRVVDFCSGASLLVRRHLWTEVGGFDPQLAPAYYEDVDLCFAIHNQGSDVVYRADSVVLHREGSSHGRGSFGLKRRQFVNRDVFAEKWSEELMEQDHARTVASWVTLESRDRRHAGHVLVCDHGHLDVTADAGSVRMDAILRGLVGMGLVVHFLPVGYFRNLEWVDSISQIGVEVLDRNLEVGEFLSLYRDHLDFVLVSRPSVMAEISSMLNLYAPQVPLIYDMVDAHGLRLRRKAEISGNPSDLRDSAHIEAVERRSAKIADITVAVSQSEVDHITAVSGVELTTMVIPTIHAAVGDIRGFDYREGILFVGGFQHDPNVDAATFLVREILPKVEKQIGTVPVTIVGSRATQEIHDLRSKSVSVLGWVEDLHAVYARHRYVVAPLRYGAGVKGKIGEALSHGIPVITTPIGVEGYELRPGEDILIGSTADEIADLIVEVYKDREKWTTLSANGTRAVEKTAGLPALREQLQQMLSLVKAARPN